LTEQGKVCIIQKNKQSKECSIKEEVVEMPEVIYKVDLPAFTGRNVPIKEIASAIGKDAQYVRLGLQQGILKFGTAIKVGNSNEYSYYCPDKRVWEETGYFNEEAV
jgi:hypothetical protein